MDEQWWRSRCCAIHGQDSPVAAVIFLETCDPESPYPYSETALCRECLADYGIGPALAHNRECRESAGVRARIKIGTMSLPKAQS